VPVHCDQPALRRTGVDPEHRRGRGVDHPQLDAPAALDLHHFGVGQCAVIGEIGVPVVIVQVHGHAAHGAVIHTRHVAHALHARRGGGVAMVRAAGDLLQNLLGRLEREVVQEKHHFLPVGAQVFRRPHDQRRREQPHLLDRHMAVHPVGARPRLVIIRTRLSRGEKGHRHVRNAILLVRGDLAMPVDDRADVEIVGQIDTEPLSRIKGQALAAGTGKAEDGCRTTIDVERAGCG